MVINPQKLLPPSQEKGGSLAKVSSSNLSLNVSTKKIDTKKLIGSNDDDKQLENIKKTLINIDSLLKSLLSADKKKENKKRKERENADFQKEEQKLEAPKESKKFNLPSLSVPRMGFLDRIKRFIFFTALGWLFTKFHDQLPKLLGIVKIIGGVYNVAENIFKFVLESFVNFIDRGYKVYDKTREIVKGIGGEKAEKEFDNLSGKLNEYINYVLIGGMALTGAIKGFNSQSKKVAEKVTVEATKKAAGAAARTVEGAAARTVGEVASGAAKQAAGKVASGAAKQAAGKVAIRQLLRIAKGPLTKLPIIGGLIEFGLSAALGDPLGKAAFRGVGTILLGAVGSLILPGFGTFVGGWAGAELAAKLYEVLFENKKPTGPEKPVQKKANGGPVTRGGVSINRPIGRTSATQQRKRKRKKLIAQPSKPGKDVGGEKKISKLYPNPDDRLSVTDWINATDANGDPLAGNAQGYQKEQEKNIGKKPNPYKALTNTSKTLKKGGEAGILMAAGVDLAMGQNMDNNFMGSFSKDTLLKSKVNEVIQNIKKELSKKVMGGGKETPSPDASPDSGGGTVESVDMTGLSSEDVDALGRMIQAESGGESDLGKAGVMNVILNRYRLAKSGKGYLPRGRTKDTVTIRDLLYAPNQFSPITDGSFGRTSSAAGRSALAKAISAGGNDPEKLKQKLMQSGLSEQDADYVIVTSSFSNPDSRGSRPFNTREVRIGNHVFQESPNARLRSPGQKFEAKVTDYSGNLSNKFLNNFNSKLPGITLEGQRYGASRDNGKRQHAGRDYDLSINGVFHSQIGGVVIFAGDGGSGYGNVVDIYNKDLNRTERIAEATTILPGIREGIVISPGQPVVSGTHQTGVIHYEIRKGKSGASGSIAGTENPDDFLNSNTYADYIKKIKEESSIPKPGQPQSLTPQGQILKSTELGPGSVITIRKNSAGQVQFYENGKLMSAERIKVLKKNHPDAFIPPRQKPQVQGSSNPNVIDRIRQGLLNILPSPSSGGGQRSGEIRSGGYVYYQKGGKYYAEKSGQNPIEIQKNMYDAASVVGDKKQGGGLIGQPNRRNVSSLSSYPSYDSGGGMMIAIQPIIVEKPIPVSTGGNKTIMFPVLVGVNNSNRASLNRG